MAVSREDWNGLVRQRADPIDGISMVLPVRPSDAGGSGTFLARCSDETYRWIKPHNNLQGGKVVVSELLVGSVGNLLGAPVCDTCVVRIPQEMEGWQFRPGSRLSAGFGCGSAMVPGAVETRDLSNRSEDDNRRRHAGVFALYDWCWGSDDQWLISTALQNACYSHDHGWYFPPAGPDWSSAELLRTVREPHLPEQPEGGLDRGELERLAQALMGITRAQLRDVLVRVPNSWPVTDEDLETMGYYLESRAPAVADRLRGLAR